MDWEAFYSSFRKPDFIPGYEIEHRLGGGAFGEVYKAHKHSIGKAFAIKFLKLDDDVQKSAVQRELEQVRHFAAIDHPNLVSIEDMGVALGVPYVIMGYAGEETLGKRLTSRELSREQALSYFVQSCRGVLALHDRRLVHFDIKPGNVFLNGDIARVGDYGLSKLMTEGRLTLSFGRGTPHYMAPEMMKGRADQRADIYSLGVLLFESIARRVPFEVRGSVGIVMRETDQPPEFPEDFPADLRRVVERCLRMDPEERYASVDALLEDLGQTARRGDSIRIDQVIPESAPASIAAQFAATRAAGVRADADPPSSSELRNTAAELTRGAVEVARGVWDGLRTVRTPGSGDADPSTGAGAAGEEHARSLAGEVGQANEALVAALDAATNPGAVDPSSTAENEPGASGPTETPGPGTIPVPPRVSGGPLGVLISSVRLAAEVLITLVGGVVGAVGGVISRAHRRIRERSTTRIGKGFRLAVFYVLLALVGSAILNVAVALFQ